MGTRRFMILVGAAVAVIALTLAAGDAIADPQTKKPTLYVEQIEDGKGEVFVTYAYQTGLPPDPEDVLELAQARCRRMGYANAVRSGDPTVHQCLAVTTISAQCVRERATDNFACTAASSP